LLAATLYQGNSDRNHKLWNIYQMRDIYSICRCCWDVATHKWKVQNGKIEIISFVVSFVLNHPALLISRCSSRYEADLFASVVSFISGSMG
jgi:hypothetical protein